ANADALAHGARFPQDGTPTGLGHARIIKRAQPGSGLHEDGAVLRVPVVQRGAADRFEMPPGFTAADRAERNGRHVRAVSRNADTLDRLGAGCRQDSRADQSAGLALVRRHAVGRIALGVLDVTVALAM